MRRLGWVVFVGVAFLLASPASAATTGRIEVFDVSGIIDANVEHGITRTLERAERERAKLVVLEMNSNGVVGAGRAERLAERIRNARVTVVTWVGPAGARVRDGAALIWWAADYTATAPATTVGPIRNLDLRTRSRDGELTSAVRRFEGSLGAMSADEAKRTQRVDFFPGSVGDLLTALDGQSVPGGDPTEKFDIDPRRDAIRLHKLDLIGRVLHAAAQPSIVYLLVLLGLVGIVFELFHPSTGPAGFTGALAMALAVYGLVALGGSWLGFALIVAGVGAFAIDLRYQSLGVLTLAGFGALVAGSILLFSGPWLRVPPWLIAGGVAAMTAFLLGAMTRVLRDLRLVASGQLEVRDAHEAVLGGDNGHGGTDGR